MAQDRNIYTRIWDRFCVAMLGNLFMVPGWWTSRHSPSGDIMCTSPCLELLYNCICSHQANNAQILLIVLDRVMYPGVSPKHLFLLKKTLPLLPFALFPSENPQPIKKIPVISLICFLSCHILCCIESKVSLKSKLYNTKTDAFSNPWGQIFHITSVARKQFSSCVLGFVVLFKVCSPKRDITFQVVMEEKETLKIISCQSHMVHEKGEGGIGR